ncbi:MAG: metal ABC transporter substrate-binding protein [Treponema sp.]|nr:metal ABC transporter substrate-binding protein [Treponema sp.]
MKKNKQNTGSKLNNLNTFRTIILLLSLFFTACSAHDSAGWENKISVITTIFPPYDFVRTITDGADIQLRMLLKPGEESHSYEPAPQDIIAIQRSDVFIYVGGESDVWVRRILNSFDPKGKKIISLLDCVEPVEEEIVEGMIDSETEDDAVHDDASLDTHVWTSPRNAKLIAKQIAETLCEADPDRAPLYRENTAAFLNELDELDAEFKSIVDGAARRTLIFADRFPFRYFTDAYGLAYFAAFPGCSTDTEPSAAAVIFLVDKARAEKIPLILFTEFSNRRMAGVISEETGSGMEMFHSAHNISRDEMSSGATYLGIMRHNAAVLRKALW